MGLAIFFAGIVGSAFMNRHLFLAFLLGIACGVAITGTLYKGSIEHFRKPVGTYLNPKQQSPMPRYWSGGIVTAIGLMGILFFFLVGLPEYPGLATIIFISANLMTFGLGLIFTTIKAVKP
jgi:hypothetical protein